eukprot:TRINITY_DN71794_c0_g1_i1.p1 TRINITY_DN71794_c0_g1~~TRINITY_DN71794_c0_g1_i1.p1  ORF type:complete len:223 (+),score=25.49 TRINITY_DN71794_c0_g1_i1:177-845(+)
MTSLHQRSPISPAQDNQGDVHPPGTKSVPLDERTDNVGSHGATSPSETVGTGTFVDPDTIDTEITKPNEGAVGSSATESARGKASVPSSAPDGNEDPWADDGMVPVSPPVQKGRLMVNLNGVKWERDDDYRRRHKVPRPGQFWRRLRKIPKKTLALSLFLFTGGCILLPLGILGLLHGGDRDRAIAMTVVGSIMFLPGTYSFAILFNYLRGVAGWHYRDLPE